MTSETWRVVLVAALAANAVLGFAYRLFRLTRGGPLGDVVGQAILGAALAAAAAAIAAGYDWVRFAALAYGLLFAVIVMPLWILAVLIPLPPRPLDYGFAAAYWAALVVVVVAALAL